MKEFEIRAMRVGKTGGGGGLGILISWKDFYGADFLIGLWHIAIGFWEIKSQEPR